MYGFRAVPAPLVADMSCIPQPSLLPGVTSYNTSPEPRLQVCPSCVLALQACPEHCGNQLCRLEQYSNASTAAMDSKIAQAMDLVKFHLKVAMRDQVEALTEQFINLTKENEQLRTENDVLKLSATPETMAKLNANSQTTQASAYSAPTNSQYSNTQSRDASTVGIDKKIEESMDLVKHHLKIAVCDEVEVLTEQIKNLTEKNEELNIENYILKNTC